MSKASQRHKNSKSGRHLASEKSLEKGRRTKFQREIAEAARPEPLSLKTDHRGKPLGDLTQLLSFVAGFALLAFAICYSGTIASDFIALLSEGYSALDYFTACDPVAACRVADVSEALSIGLSLILAIITFKMALTNRHPKLVTLRIGFVLAIVMLVLLTLNTVLDQIFW